MGAVIAVAWARCAVGLEFGAGAALLLGALITVVGGSPADAQQAPAAAPADQPGPATSSPAPVELPPIEVEAPPAPVSTRGPSVSPTGANAYGVTSTDIGNMPAGENTTITDVLAQMPGVAIDQNQQIHIRNTEGPQFQYQINGALVPLDINTNPPFISNFSSLFVSRLDLLDGVLPSRYSYATGGVVDIQSKAGNCDNPGGRFSLFAGQRDTIQPSVQYAGCTGDLSYYVSGLYDQSNTAFSSATPGANAIHDWTNQGQTFNSFSYPLDDKTKLGVIISAAGSNNQLPNRPDLTPQFSLAGVSPFNSAEINSYLNFRDYLGMVFLSGKPTADLSYQIAYAAHSISEQFKPDNAGELIYEGVASTASHNDLDNTLEGDLSYKLGSHTLGTGFYFGEYRVIADDTSLVFPVDANGNQTSTTPITVVNNAHATNFLAGIYVDDLWQINDQLRLSVGLRYDVLTGFTNSTQFDPTINLSYLPTSETTLHGGFARYMQVPSFQGISPTASAAFAGTSAAGPPGIATPVTEDDFEWDVGVVHHLTPKITLSQDNFFEITDHYLDTGQFGVVPIFAPFNYGHGSIWGSETAINYKDDKFAAYGNVTVGRNLQRGVVTGQFNFPPDELAFIDSHHIVLDHQPLLGASAGATYKWEPLTFSLDMIYSGGLRAGFADTEQLPTVVQINAAAQIAFHVPGIGEVTDRLTVLNVLDRVNLIRPPEGIGIFQSAYGPRLTVLNTLTVPF
jgi:outer membrane receptor protein involved in Fe transport